MCYVKVPRHPALILLILIGISGCGDENDRVAQIALQSSQRQAAQNQEMAQLNREVAEGTRRLTEERGEADRQMLALEDNLQKQRDELEIERRQIAAARNRESLLVPMLKSSGMLAVCSLPLVLCWYLLHGLGRESSEAAISQLLVEELLQQDNPLPLDVAKAGKQPQTALR